MDSLWVERAGCDAANREHRVNANEVDQFLRDGRRSLLAAPEWRIGNRTGERRSTLPVSHNSSSSTVTLEITVRLLDPDYLMMLLLADRSVFCRLCMTTGHMDRLTKREIDQAHFHSWEANRGTHRNIPKALNNLEIVPNNIMGRDAAFIWFLQRNNIESPSWLPPAWPHGQLL